MRWQTIRESVGDAAGSFKAKQPPTLLGLCQRLFFYFFSISMVDLIFNAAKSSTAYIG